MTAQQKSPQYTDKSWVRDIFLVGKEDLDGIPLETRTWSTADFKFNNTSIGGSIVINPLPQPNYFSDPFDRSRVPGLEEDRMGPFFSETYDDNYRIVSFRLGTLAFNSLLGFLNGMYSPAASHLANRGRVSDWFFTIGKVIGFGIQLIGLPIVMMGLVGKAAAFFMRKPSGKYAYLKPAMPLYWSSVQTIFSHFMINMGLVYPSPPVSIEGQTLDLGEYNPSPLSKDDLAALRTLHPDLITSDNFTPGQAGTLIDVFKVATKGQRLAYKRRIALEQLNFGDKNIDRMLANFYRQRGLSKDGYGLAKYLEAWKNTSIYATLKGDANQANPSAESSSTDSENGTKPVMSEIADSPQEPELSSPSFLSFLEAEIRDGGAFVSFRVDDTGSVSESFSNNYKPSSLAEKINSAAASARSTMFNLAGGNIADNPLADTVEKALGGVKSLFEGTIETLGLSGLAIMGGGGTLDMPKYWESSETQVAKPGYSFTLTSRYGNRKAALQDIFLPLSCILAMALPLSTGKHSHTSPFYLEFYDKGRMQTRLGAIDSLSISRGDGTMGFTPDGHVMSITVNFSIIPMEEVLAMPVSEGFSITDTLLSVAAGGLVGGLPGAFSGGALQTAFGLTSGIFDDDTPFMDYMAVLSGLGLNEQLYLTDKLRRRYQMNAANMASSFSIARMASFTADTVGGRILSAFSLKRVER